jgi:hypothetical protein
VLYVDLTFGFDTCLTVSLNYTRVQRVSGRVRRRTRLATSFAPDVVTQLNKDIPWPVQTLKRRPPTSPPRKVPEPAFDACSSTYHRVLETSGGGAKKKLTAYNKFMQNELARLKEKEPELEHKDRSVTLGLF